MVKGVVEDVEVNNCSPQQQKGGVVNFIPLIVWLWQGRKSGNQSVVNWLGR